MLDANALMRNHKSTLKLLKTSENDKPIAAQLVGSDPELVLDAAQKLLSIVDISFLDINCACPAKKIIKKKSGSYLLKDPKMLYKLLHKLTSSLPIPITVKLRTGFSKRDVLEILTISKNCQESGASMLFVHGRTRDQGYAGDVDYEAIKAIKEVVKIPVFGSGNILNPPLAKKMFDETGCDGILVARGAFGNPWIFEEIEKFLETGEINEPKTLAVKKNTLREHLELVKKLKDLKESSKIGFMRKIAMWYLKGLPEATRMRERICNTKSYSELVSLIKRIK